MRCPVCVETDLVMSERQTIEIDYCPKCRGVWLDRGELDKIIERSAAEAAPAAAAPAPPMPPQQPGYGYDPRGHDGRGAYDPRGGYGHHGKPYRKKSWLHEIFD